MSIAVNFTVGLQWIEEVVLFGTTTPYNHTEMNILLQNLNNSSPNNPVFQGSAFATTLSGSTATIDLTNLPKFAGTSSEKVDGSNGGGTSVADRVQFFVIQNKGTHVLTVSQAGANSYALLGATYSFTIEPNQYLLLVGYNLTPQVLSSAKNILVTGTSGDTFWTTVIFG